MIAKTFKTTENPKAQIRVCVESSEQATMQLFRYLLAYT